jgi:LmbE family N-acetylglucosaminyl deacetylase
MRPVAEIIKAFEGFPETGILDLLNGRRALILAPHPDDESLGCGGFIAAACGVDVSPLVVVLTDGAASHPGSQAFPPERLRAMREAETCDAAKRLGLPAENLVFLGYPDTCLPAFGPGFEDAVARVADITRLNGCGVLIGPWQGDPHCDHEAAARIAETVAVRNGLRLLSYPVWGWLRAGTDVVPEARRHGWRLDIRAQLAAKQQAIAAHVSQYGGLITDSPDRFQLPAALLQVFARPFEVFLE